MRVLHVSYYLEQGGAARACQRLMTELSQAGIQNIVVYGSDEPPSVVFESHKRGGSLIDNISYKLDRCLLRAYPKRKNGPFSINLFQSSLRAEWINRLCVDVVHIHWIGRGFLSFDELNRIEPPIVWTVHDDWPITAGCHVAGECIDFLNQCGSCRFLGTHSKAQLSSMLFKRKSNLYDLNHNITFVALSSWMEGRLRKSPMTREKPVVSIPNPFDVDGFTKHLEASDSIDFMTPEFKYILFGAVNATTDENKGFHVLIEALLEVKVNFKLIVFGASRPELNSSLDERCLFLGTINDDSYLAALYKSVDVVAVPSRQESFGQVALEALLSSTPVVCFDGTGMDDLIDHRITGYRAIPGSASDFAVGLNYFLSKNTSSHTFKVNKKIERFRSSEIIDSYIALYNGLISEDR